MDAGRLPKNIRGRILRVRLLKTDLYPKGGLPELGGEGALTSLREENPNIENPSFIGMESGNIEG
jgi:hypothetical protein